MEDISPFIQRDDFQVVATANEQAGHPSHFPYKLHHKNLPMHFYSLDTLACFLSPPLKFCQQFHSILLNSLTEWSTKVELSISLGFLLKTVMGKNVLKNCLFGEVTSDIKVENQVFGG